MRNPCGARLNASEMEELYENHFLDRINYPLRSRRLGTRRNTTCGGRPAISDATCQFQPQHTVVHANGGTASFQMNFIDHFAGVAELGAEHNGNIHNVHLDNTWTTYLFGPRVSITKRSSRIVPAFECLFGGVNVAASIKSPLLPDIPGARLTAEQTAFAMAVGGTLDIRLNHRISIRPIQLDYLLTRLSSKPVLNGFETFNQNNLRYGAGVVFRFGSTQ
jgi:hypothetical protein